jgi:adenylate cyclase
MERKLAAILAGDVVGYSRLMAEDGAATYQTMRRTFDEIVAPEIDRHLGRIFKTTGDGVLASFASANEALSAALEIQRTLEDQPLKLRIGLNLGDVIEENGDVFGDGVNVAARLQAMAEPGGICASAAIMRSADGTHSGRFKRIGRRWLKNIPEPVEIFAMRQADPTPKARFFAFAHRKLALGFGAVALVAAGAGPSGIEWFRTVADPLASKPAVTARDLATEDTRPVVAVLPFQNLSGDPGQNYFADGLTEDIIADLARNRDLLVIARNSTFAFKDRATDIRTIGTALGAAYVVEGSARRSGDQLRVVAQLIDARSGTHLWSRSYDRRVEDVFEMQSDLTSRIVASLLSYVRQSESAAAVSRPTGNARAYDLVLQARSRFPHGSKDKQGLLEARDMYRRAIELDPDYAAAHALFALTFIVDSTEAITGEFRPADLDRALAEAREAVRLQPDLALGYQILSYGLAVNGDYDASLKAGERAVELSPSDPDSLMALAKAQVRFGSYQQALANAERARRLHPMTPAYYYYVHGQALYAMDRVPESEKVLAECLSIAPREANCLRLRAAALVRLNRSDEARRTMMELIELEPRFSLAGERSYRRFGDSPLMAQYLRDLAAAGAPDAAADAGARTKKAIRAVRRDSAA